MTVAYLGVGSNIDPEHNIPAALDLLANAVTVTGVSTFYQTEPLDRPDQPPFFNGAFACETSLPPGQLKCEVLRSIEQTLGRRRTADKHAARPIDLDVVLYGELVCTSQELTLPDRDLYRRPFLAVPLLELAPTLVLPDSGRRLQVVVEGMDLTGLKPLARFSQRLRESIALVGERCDPRHRSSDEQSTH